MSFPAGTSYQNEKVSEPLRQDFDDIFDQFFDFTPQEEDALAAYNAHPESTLVSSLDSTDDEAKHNASLDNISGESWANQVSALPQPGRRHQLYSELSGRAAISDSQLLSVEGMNLESPPIPSSHQFTSLPTSPSLDVAADWARRRQLMDTHSKTLKRRTESVDQGQLRSSIRKTISTPRMRGGSGAWTHRLEFDTSKFNFDLQPNALPLSPPSSRTSNASETTRTLRSMKGQSRTRLSSANNSIHRMVHPAPYDTPLATPTLEDHFPSTPTHQRVPSFQMPSTPRYQMPSGSWSQIPATPGFDAFSPSLASPTNMDASVWWNNVPTSPMEQTSPPALHLNTQQESKAMAMQLQNNMAYAQNELPFNPSDMASGLMIQMPSNNLEQSSFVMEPPPMMRQGFFAPRPQEYQHSVQRTRPEAPSWQLGSPTKTHRKSHSTSSDSEPPSPKATIRPQLRKRKSSARVGKSSSSGRAPSGCGGGVDFVNFTPNDSKKILTGVAPSGSSKTKARREKEALEKRRKLSQAALKAVRAAGGDVESLVEQGLFV